VICEISVEPKTKENQNEKQKEKKNEKTKEKIKIDFFLFILSLYRFLITKTIYNDRQSKFGYIDACD
jgi:hypothetical protein